MDLCDICGDLKSTGFIQKLDCGHEFHYECLIKSFNHSYNVERDRKCPDCREKTDYFEKPSTVRRKRKIRRLRAIKKATQSKDL